MSRIRVNHKVNLGWCFKSLCLAGSLYLVTRGFIELCEWSERAKKSKKHEEIIDKNREVIEKAGENMDAIAEFLKKCKIKPADEEEKEPVEEVTEANFDGEKEYFDEEKMEFVYKDA